MPHSFKEEKKCCADWHKRMDELDQQPLNGNLSCDCECHKEGRSWHASPHSFKEIRERFKKFYAKLPYQEVGDRYPDQLIADFFESEFSAYLEGKREEVLEVLKPEFTAYDPEDKEHQLVVGAISDYHNVIAPKILNILSNENSLTNKER